MEIIKNKRFDEERALYGRRDIDVRSSSFDGPADGESAFKECSNVAVSDCYFNLRYPFWHDHVLTIRDSEMTDKCRAALWYSDHIDIRNTKMHGIKALRECSDVHISDCDIISPEFGWSVHNITMEKSKAESEYFMMRSSDIRFIDVSFTGKYSFQYIEDAIFENCELNTKDAFWHSKNVTAHGCVINGEYLAWYSDGLTLIDCTISGTQPFCYCRNLRLVNCRLLNADLAFEKSTVDAEITTPVISIKNPRSGIIRVPSVSEIIMDDNEAEGKIEIIS